MNQAKNTSANSVRVCQNCKNKFTIETEDFVFYEKIGVPAPTFCPVCRFQRRLMFRNDKTLYKRTCDLCNKNIVSIIAPDKPYVVYCNQCWWSDAWDMMAYGQDYDPNRHIFDQFKELLLKVPHMPLVIDFYDMVNSDYVNHAGQLKNCYLVFNGDLGENAFYCNKFTNVKDSMDVTSVNEVELCYEVINCQKSYQVFYSEDVENCHNVYFSKNLTGCTDCIGCVNLKNKQYYIFNEPYTKEDYEAKKKEFLFRSYENIEKFKEKAHSFWQEHPTKHIRGRHNKDVTGDYINNSKNAHDCFIVSDVEDSKYCQWITMPGTKGCYDYTEWGNVAENIYEGITVGAGANMVKFCFACWEQGTMNVEYSMYLVSCSNMFASTCMRKRQYCILNKQYSKEEYEKLRAHIIEEMKKNPYVDSKGRVFSYGEFLPYDLSLYGYNESCAMGELPLSKEQIEEKGYKYYDKKDHVHTITKKAKDLPDDVCNVSDEILGDVIECMECKKAFRIVASELKLLRQLDLPIPRECFFCRDARRSKRMHTAKFYDSVCSRCNKPLRSSYSPGESTNLYCEKCYQEEVI